jgi:hypothetical protein
MAERCAARACPVPGTMPHGSRKGVRWCVYHCACPDEDHGNVTRALMAHAALLRICEDGRPFVKADIAEQAGVLRELRERFERWRLEHAGQGPMRLLHVGSTLESWLTACETLLGGLVQGSMQSVKRKRA